jgi:hypothetical protein
MAALPRRLTAPEVRRSCAFSCFGPQILIDDLVNREPEQDGPAARRRSLASKNRSPRHRRCRRSSRRTLRPRRLGWWVARDPTAFRPCPKGSAIRPTITMVSSRTSRVPRIHVTAGTSNSTTVRLTRQKSALFQWLAVPLWFPTDKNSVPTDSGILFECVSTGRLALSPALGGLIHELTNTL